MGYPAVNQIDFARQVANVKNLSRTNAELSALKKQVKELQEIIESKINNI